VQLQTEPTGFEEGDHGTLVCEVIQSLYSRFHSFNWVRLPSPRQFLIGLSSERSYLQLEEAVKQEANISYQKQRGAFLLSLLQNQTTGGKPFIKKIENLAERERLRREAKCLRCRRPKQSKTFK
jgi:hypothetical protein